MSIKKMLNSALAVLLILSLLSTINLFVMLDKNQNNGRVINYSGIIRGGSQRAVKLHLIGQPENELATNLEKIMDGLISGDESLQLQKPRDKAFVEKMEEIKGYWEANLKPLLNQDSEKQQKDLLLKNSETFFQLTNEAVALAETFAAQGIVMVKIASIVTFFVNALLIYIISRIIHRKILIPVKELESGMAKLSQGELEFSVNHESNNELGNLAESMRSSIETISGYISEVDRAMESMSNGNFDITLTKEFIGDFKNLEKSILGFRDNISNTFHQINIVSEQVSRGSEQVANGAQALAQGATEQASSVEELSATINEITEKINETANHVKNASSLVSETGNEVLDGNRKMKEMILAMDEISAKSAEINKIIKTIDDIAFQTNILALNAAVEAARAGSAGKGFAVVADEVRNLAQKSAEAAKNTTDLIESSIAAVGNGVAIAKETAQSLVHIVENSELITQRIEEIATSSIQQAEGANQISIGVDQIAAVVQTNSATAEEGAASSEELSSQSQLLKDLIDKFKLKEITYKDF